MPTLTIRRLEKTDKEWLQQMAQSEGISMEEYARGLIRDARLRTNLSFGDIVNTINTELDDDARALLHDAPEIERVKLTARDVFPTIDGSKTLKAS